MLRRPGSPAAWIDAAQRKAGGPNVVEDLRHGSFVGHVSPEDPDRSTALFQGGDRLPRRLRWRPRRD